MRTSSLTRALSASTHPATLAALARGRRSAGGYVNAVAKALKPARVWLDSDTREPMESLYLALAIQTVNPLNRREHFHTRAKRSKEERENIYRSLLVMARGSGPLPPLPVTVTLTRVGPRLMDVGDGLNASFKAIRDGIQDAYGVDDGSDLFDFRYEQEKSKAYGIRIHVMAKRDAAPSPAAERGRK